MTSAAAGCTFVLSGMSSSCLRDDDGICVRSLREDEGVSVGSLRDDDGLSVRSLRDDDGISVESLRRNCADDPPPVLLRRWVDSLGREDGGGEGT